MIEFLDTMYDGWFGRVSLTSLVIGAVLFVVALMAAEHSHKEWPEILGMIGAFIWLVVFSTACGAGLLRLFAWTVTGE